MAHTPETLHPLIESVEDKQELVAALYAGTIEMRDAGTKYLPQEPGETSENYANRLARSVLFPAYKQAVKANTGKLYTKEVTVSDTNELMEQFLEQVDEDENDLTEFAKQTTENAIHNGCSYILIDYPVMNDNSTLEDEIQAGGRPYWVNIKQSQVIEASPVKRNGKNVLGIFRFKEQVAFRVDAFAVQFIDQIKQFQFDENNEVEYLVFRKDETDNWILFDRGQLIAANGVAFTEIPIVAVNVEPVGFYVGQPVFYDLGEENKQHWQMLSDYNNIVHATQVPMLVVTGKGSSHDEDGNPSGAVVISPNSTLEFSSPEAKVAWLEVNGKAAAVGEGALASSLKRMAVMSLQLLANTDAKATATASKIGAIDSLSILQSIGKVVEQALDKAIDFTYKYYGIEDQNTTVEINLDDAVIIGNVNDIDSLIKMNETGLLSKETTLTEIQRRGVISDKVDVKKEAQTEAATPTPNQLNDEV